MKNLPDNIHTVNFVFLNRLIKACVFKYAGEEWKTNYQSFDSQPLFLRVFIRCKINEINYLNVQKRRGNKSSKEKTLMWNWLDNRCAETVITNLKYASLSKVLVVLCSRNADARITVKINTTEHVSCLLSI